MARLFLIIDGYNLMHAIGLARRTYGPGDLERCRNRLIQQVTSALDPVILADSVIVFDATQSGPRDPPQLSPGPLHVVYSRDGRDADAEIEMMLSMHSSPKQVLVISSDHRLHKAASRRRARCMDSEEFCHQLENSHEQPQRKKPLRRDTPAVSGRISNRPKRPASQKPTTQQKPTTSALSGSESDSDYAQDFLSIDVDEIKRAVRKEKR
jgi:predicted RNA-binding protein with PIN domain